MPYREVWTDWAEVPPGWDLVEVVGVASDSQGRVYVFNRGDHPLCVFSSSGRFLSSWGESLFKRPHGIHVDSQDRVWCTDDLAHTVRCFTTDGQPLLTLGSPGQPSDTGCRDNDYRTIARSAGPFNQPTNVALSPEGDIFVTDGYGNARVHRFSPAGDLLASWGEPGTGPGQFQLPHGIAIDSEGILYVADRENSRIQLFDLDGAFIREWTGFQRPTQIFAATDGFLYVSELGWKAGVFPGLVKPPHASGGRVAIVSPNGHVEARWGGGHSFCAPGDFYAPHDIWVTPDRAVYVSEVVKSSARYGEPVDPDCHILQKFQL